MSWDAPTLYLVVSAIGAVFTLSALVRGRHLGPFVAPYFFAAWLTSELAGFHVVWQAAATLIFAVAGAFERWEGWLGLGITVTSWLGLAFSWARSRQAGDAFERALDLGLGTRYRDSISEERRATLREEAPRDVLLRPFHFKRPGVVCVKNIAYGDAGKRNRLDVYKPAEPGSGRPVLLQIHGGGWVIGEKEQQALPLMNHLAERGWVCVAINYRLSPGVRFPEHLIDAKRALAWIRKNIAQHGGDPNFVAVTGGSAGGHLCALMALTANDPELQPGFEDVDTTLAACVPFYGIYDFLDRENVRGFSKMTPFLRRVVMPGPPEEHPKLWDKASPVAQVRPDAPPFFVIHGTHDSLAFVEDARLFVEKLRGVSRRPVVYAEIPGAQHAFDIFHSLRSTRAVNAVSQFLEFVHSGDRKMRNAS